jgi:heme/copper-type cytochrome/quinol oxidase subunit 3
VLLTEDNLQGVLLAKLHFMLNGCHMFHVTFLCAGVSAADGGQRVPGGHQA